MGSLSELMMGSASGTWDGPEEESSSTPVSQTVSSSTSASSRSDKQNQKAALRASMDQYERLERFFTAVLLRLNDNETVLPTKGDHLQRKLREEAARLRQLIDSEELRVSQDVEQLMTEHREMLKGIQSFVHRSTERVRHPREIIQAALDGAPITRPEVENAQKELEAMTKEVRASQSSLDLDLGMLRNVEVSTNQMHGELMDRVSSRSLFFLRTSSLLPQDVSLTLRPQSATGLFIGRPVDIEVKPSKADPALESLMMCDIKDESHNSVAFQKMADSTSRHGVVLIQFTPRSAGKHVVSVELYQQAVKNSPMTFVVERGGEGPPAVDDHLRSLLASRRQPQPPSRSASRATTAPGPLSPDTSLALSDEKTAPDHSFGHLLRGKAVARDLSNSVSSSGMGGQVPANRDTHHKDHSTSSGDARATTPKPHTFLSQAPTYPPPEGITLGSAVLGRGKALRGTGGMPCVSERAAARAGANGKAQASVNNGGSSTTAEFGSEDSSLVERTRDLIDMEAEVSPPPAAQTAPADAEESTRGIMDRSWSWTGAGAEPGAATAPRATGVDVEEDWESGLSGEMAKVKVEEEGRHRQESEGSDNTWTMVESGACGGGDLETGSHPPPGREISLVEMFERNKKKPGLYGRELLTLGCWGKSDNPLTYLNAPIGCTRDERTGRWIICDTNNNTVKIFNADGTANCMIKGLVKPSAVVMLDRGAMAKETHPETAMAVKDDLCIHIYMPSGNFIRKMGQDQLRDPRGLALDEAGNVVTLNGAFRAGATTEVMYYDPTSGTLVKRLPYNPLVHSPSRSGQGDRGPQPRFMDARGGRLVVSDLGKNLVYVTCTESGEEIGRFGGDGRRPGMFKFASGISMDSGLAMLIGDAKNNRVQLFDKDGYFKCVVELGVDGAVFVSDLHMTPDGLLMVMSRAKHVVKIFKLESKV